MFYLSNISFLRKAICPLLALLPLSASAGNVLVEPVETSPITTSNLSYVFNVPVFNSSLGTLIAVELKLTLNSAPQLDVFNNNSVAESFTLASAKFPRGTATLSYPGSSGTNMISVRSQNAVIRDPSGTVGANGEFTMMGMASSASNDNLPYTSNFGSAFAGSSGQTLPLTLNLTDPDGTYRGKGPGRVAFSGENDLFATLQVDYVYSNCPSAPEPTSLSLAGLALGGLLLRFWTQRLAEA